MKQLMRLYKKIILDFDGVIADTNSIKKQNILSASLNFLSESEANSFATFFTRNNGIPREKKIFSYFSDHAIAKDILNSYNMLNENLINAKTIEGLEDFLIENNDIPISILSGGARSEIESFLLRKSLRKYFAEIMCGPKTKEENLDLVDLIKPALFIGDSAHDYEVAQKFSLDFVFLYGTSQEVELTHEKFPGALFYKNFKKIKFVNYEKD